MNPCGWSPWRFESRRGVSPLCRIVPPSRRLFGGTQPKAWVRYFRCGQQGNQTQKAASSAAPSSWWRRYQRLRRAADHVAFVWFRIRGGPFQPGRYCSTRMVPNKTPGAVPRWQGGCVGRLGCHCHPPRVGCHQLFTGSLTRRTGTRLCSRSPSKDVAYDRPLWHSARLPFGMRMRAGAQLSLLIELVSASFTSRISRA